MENDEQQEQLSETSRPDEVVFDNNLRPNTLEDYIGQSHLKDGLHVFLAAAKKRGEPLEHVLLHGAPGLGKTTLAHILAKETGVDIRITSGPALERAGDVAAILSNLEPNTVLFIDEIHRLNRAVEEILYPAMEDFQLDIVLGKGPAARSVRLELPKFTLVGATTRLSLLSAPLRDRFGATYRLDFYTPEELLQIIARSARILGVTIDEDSARAIATRARRTPRIANRLLKRVRDYADVHSAGHISPDLANTALDQLDIDPLGLDESDRKILRLIIEQYQGGPVGLSTLAAAVAEDIDTLEEIYEPYLMQIGMLSRTPRGRVVTAAAYEHLGYPVPESATL
jgi:Holliday junction DNA helicase RuvB